MFHWSELIETGKFVRRDGKTGYNLFNLKNIQNFPMLLVHSDNDSLADTDDFELLRPYLPTSAKVKFIEGWGHLDFVWSEN
jgi:pimeloyl-ACP methyl ester carboxylesterase